jgi:lipid-A-disaccharide synthase
VILYWITPLAFQVQQFFRKIHCIKVKYITLVNLLTAKEIFPADTTTYDPSAPGAEQVLFPEYLTSQDKSREIAGHIVEWLSDDVKRRGRVDELQQLKDRICHGGASSTASKYILNQLHLRPLKVPRPHFLSGAATMPADMPKPPAE